MHSEHDKKTKNTISLVHRGQQRPPSLFDRFVRMLVHAGQPPVLRIATLAGAAAPAGKRRSQRLNRIVALRVRMPHFRHAHRCLRRTVAAERRGRRRAAGCGHCTGTAAATVEAAARSGRIAIRCARLERWFDAAICWWPVVGRPVRLCRCDTLVAQAMGFVCLFVVTGRMALVMVVVMMVAFMVIVIVRRIDATHIDDLRQIRRTLAASATLVVRRIIAMLRQFRSGPVPIGVHTVERLQRVVLPLEALRLRCARGTATGTLRSGRAGTEWSRPAHNVRIEEIVLAGCVGEHAARALRGLSVPTERRLCRRRRPRRLYDRKDGRTR